MQLSESLDIKSGNFITKIGIPDYEINNQFPGQVLIASSVNTNNNQHLSNNDAKFNEKISLIQLEVVLPVLFIILFVLSLFFIYTIYRCWTTRLKTLAIDTASRQHHAQSLSNHRSPFSFSYTNRQNYLPQTANAYHFHQLNEQTFDRKLQDASMFFVKNNGSYLPTANDSKNCKLISISRNKIYQMQPSVPVQQEDTPNNQKQRPNSLKYQRTYSNNSNYGHYRVQEEVLPNQIKIIDNLSAYRRESINAQIIRNHCSGGVVSLQDVSTAVPNNIKNDFNSQQSNTEDNTSISQNISGSVKNRPMYVKRINGHYYFNDVAYSRESIISENQRVRTQIPNSNNDNSVITSLNGDYSDLFLIDKNLQNQYRNQKRTSTMDNLTNQKVTSGDQVFKKPQHLPTTQKNSQNINDTEKVVGIILSSLKNDNQKLKNLPKFWLQQQNMNASLIGGSCDQICKNLCKNLDKNEKNFLNQNQFKSENSLFFGLNNKVSYSEPVRLSLGPNSSDLPKKLNIDNTNNDASQVTSNATGSTTSNFAIHSMIQTNQLGSIVANLGSASMRTSRAQVRGRTRAMSMNNYYCDLLQKQQQQQNQGHPPLANIHHLKSFDYYASNCEITSSVEKISLKLKSQLFTMNNIQPHFV